MVFLFQHGKLTEFEEDVVKHIGLLTCNAFSDVQTVSCKPLKSQILGSTPRLYTDTSDSCKVGYDKGINAIVLVERIEWFFVLGNFFRIETVYLCAKWCQQTTGWKIIGNMYTVKSGGLKPDDYMVELMVDWKNVHKKGFKSLCTFFGIRHGLHADKKILVEINGRNNICTGSYINPNKQRWQVIGFLHG